MMSIARKTRTRKVNAARNAKIWVIPIVQPIDMSMVEMVRH